MSNETGMDRRLKLAALIICAALVLSLITFGVSAMQGFVAQYGVNAALPLAFTLLALFGAGVWGVLLLAWDLWRARRHYIQLYTIAQSADGDRALIFHMGEPSLDLRGGLAAVIAQTWYAAASRSAMRGDDYLHGVIQGFTHAAMVKVKVRITPADTK